ncbi:hypothetical protein STEG23_026607 [Scotinomys teguina]
MQPDRATNNGGRTMELVAAAPRCQLLLIVLMSAMLLPGMKVSLLLIWRKIARTIELQENIGKGQFGKVCQGKCPELLPLTFLHSPLLKPEVPPSESCPLLPPGSESVFSP